jgi:hypothetical protein
VNQRGIFQTGVPKKSHVLFAWIVNVVLFCVSNVVTAKVVFDSLIGVLIGILIDLLLIVFS